jgi:hypothetical protein
MIDIGILPSVCNHHDCGSAASPDTVVANLHLCLVEKQKVTEGRAKSRSPRKVRFAADPHGIIQTDIQTALDYDSHDMHWSNKEQERFRRRAKKDAVKCSESLSQQIQKLEVAFSNGANNGSSVACRQDMNHMLEWARGKGRGLEFHASERFRDEQICVVLESVLYYQHLILEEANYNIEETFAMFCREKTSNAREFATKMALCDAIVAQEEAHSDSCHPYH